MLVLQIFLSIVTLSSQYVKYFHNEGMIQYPMILLPRNYDSSGVSNPFTEKPGSYDFCHKIYLWSIWKSELLVNNYGHEH